MALVFEKKLVMSYAARGDIFVGFIWLDSKKEVHSICVVYSLVPEKAELILSYSTHFSLFPHINAFENTQSIECLDFIMRING